MLVIGEERAKTIRSVDEPMIATILGPDGEILTEEPTRPVTMPTPAREQDFAVAMLAYQEGNFAKAYRTALSAAQFGEVRGYVIAGTLLMKGQGVERNDTEAVRLLRLAAVGNDADALMALGALAVEGRGGLSPSDATGFYRQAANLGDAQAMRALSTLAADSDAGVAQAWESRAAGSGDVESMKRKGAAMVDSDPLAALEWLERAARAGDADSAHAAALLRLENFDIPPDERATAEMMRIAADGGIASAMAEYGLMVLQGQGVRRDEAEAARWLRRSAEAGDAEGAFMYAYTLAKGDGVAVDEAEAYYWLLKSGAQGDAARDQLRGVLEAKLSPEVRASARRRAGL